MQGYPELCADAVAMMLEIIGRGLQAVVNMESMHLPWPPLGASQEQGRGISAAAEGYGKGQSR
jgi:hypothetical protein